MGLKKRMEWFAAFKEKGRKKLVENENAQMSFALVAIVIILLSIVAAAYFARLDREQRQQSLDEAATREMKAEIDSIKSELEAGAEESGHQAVESVEKELMNNPGMDYSKEEIISMVGREANDNFEDYFEEKYGEPIHKGDQTIRASLRPVANDESPITTEPMYIELQNGTEMSWVEKPTFFNINRTARITVQDEETNSMISEQIYINETVKTTLFLMIDRMNEFEESNIRELANTMKFTYLNIKLFDSNNDDLEENWFAESFSDFIYNISDGDWEDDDFWREVYEDPDKDLEDEGDRDDPIDSGDYSSEDGEENFIQGFVRDIGRLSSNDLLSEEEIEYIYKLGLFLEQLRVFRSYDEELLVDLSDYFTISEEEFLSYIGEGAENRINVQALVIQLFKEKEEIKGPLFYPGPFVNEITSGGVMDLVDESFWKTGFEILKNIASGLLESIVDGLTGVGRAILDRDSLPLKNAAAEIGANFGFLPMFMTLYGLAKDHVHESFRVGEDEFTDFVEMEMKNAPPISLIGSIPLIGNWSAERIVDGLIAAADGLGGLLGFKEDDFDEDDKYGHRFYYTFFLSSWGMYRDLPNPNKVEDDEWPDENEDGGLAINLTMTSIENKKEDYESYHDNRVNIIDDIDNFDPDHDASDILNETRDDYLGYHDDLFDNNNYETSKHEGLKENMVEIENEDEDGETEGILDKLDNYIEDRWKFEALEYIEGKLEDVADNFDAFVDESKYLYDEFHYEDNDLPHDLDLEIMVGESDAEEEGKGWLEGIIETLGDAKNAVRGVLSRLSPFNLYHRINQNLWDLKEPREGYDESRLIEILKGDGDPFKGREGDTLNPSIRDRDEYWRDWPSLDSGDYGIDTTIDLDDIDNNIHSSDVNEINENWISGYLSKSIDRMDEARENLLGISEELSSEELPTDDPDAPVDYPAYGGASFYSLAADVLDPIQWRMERYKESISNVENRHTTIYPLEGTFDEGKLEAESDKINGGEGDPDFDSEIQQIPVTGAPRGEFVIRDAKEDEDVTTQYKFSLDVDMTVGNGWNDDLDDLVEEVRLDDGEEDEETEGTVEAIRTYEGGGEVALEWMNPFSTEWIDYYHTIISPSFDTTEFSIQLTTNNPEIVGLERYSEERYGDYFAARENQTLSTELYTPMPVVNQMYNPQSPLETKIQDVSMDRNVFNENSYEFNVTFSDPTMVNTGDDIRDYHVEVIGMRDNRYVPTWIQGPINFFSGLLGSERYSNYYTVASTKVRHNNEGLEGEDDFEGEYTKDMKDETPGEIKVNFDDWGDDFNEWPDDEEEENTLFILKVRTNISFGYMLSARALEQEIERSDCTDQQNFSFVPYSSTNEQAYLMGENRSPVIGVYEVGYGDEEVYEGDNGWQGKTYHRTDKPATTCKFRFIENISEDYWVVERDNIPFLVNFEENQNYRDRLALYHRIGMVASSWEKAIAQSVWPSTIANRVRQRFTANSELRFIRNFDFVPVYMSTEDTTENSEKLHFFPNRVLPLPRGIWAPDLTTTWQPFKEYLSEDGYHPVGGRVDVEQLFEDLLGDIIDTFSMPGPSGGDFLRLMAQQVGMQGFGYELNPEAIGYDEESLHFGLGAYLFFRKDITVSENEFERHWERVKFISTAIGAVKLATEFKEMGKEAVEVALLVKGAAANIAKRGSLTLKGLARDGIEWYAKESIKELSKLAIEDMEQEYEKLYHEIVALSKTEAEIIFDLTDEVDFSHQPIAESIEVIGEDNIGDAIEWFDDNYDEENLTSFASFDEDFVRNLPEELDEADYSSALDELDNTFSEIDMDFSKALNWDIRRKEHIQQLQELRGEYGPGLLTQYYDYNVSLDAIVNLNESGYDLVDLNENIENFEESPYISNFTEELNAHDLSSIPSLYFANRAKEEGSNVRWKVYGEDGSPLVLNETLAYYNETEANEMQIIETFIEDSIKEGSQSVDERGRVILSINKSMEDYNNLEDTVVSSLNDYSPHYHKIGIVELRYEGETVLRVTNLPS